MTRRCHAAVVVIGLFVWVSLFTSGCTTRLTLGETLYREGDRLAALETWRSISEDESMYEEAQQRIEVVEDESQQLVVRYKQRARYFEDKNRLAESIVNNRLALKLQPDDAQTLAHVQELARMLASRRLELRDQYRDHLKQGDIAQAGQRLHDLRLLDPFDPELEADQRELDEELRKAISQLLAKGRRGFSNGNHVAAARAFKSVLALDRDNESARGYLSYIDTIRRESQHASQQPAAFDLPETSASDAEIRAEGSYQNALAAQREGDLFSAIRHDLQALQSDANHQAALQQLGEIRQLLAGEVEVLIENGRVHFKNEDLQSALDSWRRALLAAPDNARVQAYVSHAERQLEDLERLRSNPDVSIGVQ
jgi:Flp pilus assembly protein TadD